jgi:MFS family permease
VLALSTVSFLNDTSSEIIYPLLPAFLALTLGANPFIIGLVEGFAESVAAFLKLFSGYLSDKFSKRKLPVFAGYALASLTRPLLAFAGNWLAFGFNRAADHLGAVFGPVAAFVLLSYLASDPANPTARDYRQVFLFASVPVALGLFVIVFFVKEERHEETIEENITPIKLSLREFDGNFKRFLLIIALFTLSNSTDAFLLLRAEESGIPVAVLPLLWMALHFSKVVFSLIGGDLSDKVGRKKMIFAGWIIYALVYAGFAFVETAWQAWALFIIYGAYFGLTGGAEKALVADLVPPEKRGTAFGFYNLAFSITVFPASIIFGALWTQFGASAAFLISALISICSAILLLTIQTNKKSENNKG